MSLSLCLVANILSAFIALDLIYFDSCHVIEEAITYILSYCKAYVDKQRQVTKKIRKILDRPFHSLEPREQEIGKLCGNVRILKFQSCKRVFKLEIETMHHYRLGVVIEFQHGYVTRCNFFIEGKKKMNEINTKISIVSSFSNQTNVN